MNTSSVRTLAIMRSLPYPPIGGAPLRNWQNINIMRKFGSVAVFALNNSSSNLDQNSSLPPGVTLWSSHQINYKQPSYVERIEKCSKLPWRLKIYQYLNINLAINKYYSYSIAQELEQVLEKFKPHLVVFEELWLYLYLPLVKRYQCKIILDTHNVEALLRREIFAATSLKSKVKTSVRLAGIESIERDFVRQVNQVWVCSDRETSLVKTLYGKDLNLHVVSNGVDVTYYKNVRLGNCNQPTGLVQNFHTLIFTASFAYRPNLFAAQLLIEQVYPQLKVVYPNCRLLLVGTNPSQSMRQAADQESGILVTGKVADIRPYMSASSVVIVPLLHGGGTRLKILEAFAAGRPVVSTSKGAEGIKVRDKEHLLICNSSESLVSGVCKIWRDSYLSQKLVYNAHLLVQQEYSWEVVGHQVMQSVQTLI